MSDPCALHDAFLRGRRRHWLATIEGMRLQMGCPRAWGEYLTLRERLSFAEDQLAAVEAEIAQRQRG